MRWLYITCIYRSKGSFPYFRGAQEEENYSVTENKKMKGQTYISFLFFPVTSDSWADGQDISRRGAVHLPQLQKA